MPLYLVRRTDPFRTQVDIDAAIFRSLTCAGAFPGLTWVRSFYNPEHKQSLCIYEAECEDDIKRHSKLASVPYDSILEVGELTPDQFWSSAAAVPLEPALAS